MAYSPMELACLRVSISSIAFFPFFFKFYKKIPADKWKYLLLVGLTGSAFPAYLFAYAETGLSSSVTSVLNSLAPLWTLLIGVVIFSKKFKGIELLGVLTGLVGTLLLLLYGVDTSFVFSLFFGAMAILATICYAIFSNVVESKLQGLNSVTISAISFCIIGPPAILYLFLGTDFVTIVQTHEYALSSLGFIAILALLGTVLATVIYFHLLQITDAVFASMIAYLIPIVGVGWGLLDGEKITVFHFLAMILILGGVYLAKRK